MVARATWLGTIALAVLVGLAAGHGLFAQTRLGTSFLIAHVRVFDGERVCEDSQVAVEAGIIRAVGRDLATWRHLPVIDGAGGTLMPGLIDAHGHVSDAEQLRQALRFGVTTVLDMGAAAVPQSQVFEVRSVAKAATDMADLRSAGFIASARRPAGSTRPVVSTVEEAKRFVAARHSEGSDYLKLQLNGVRSVREGDPNLDEATARALVEAAHSNGMLAVAHIETLDDVAIALSAGVDGLAHVWRRGGANAQIARRVAERGVFVSATLAIPDGHLDGRAGLLADPRFQGVLSDPLKEHLSRPFTPRTTGNGADELRASFDAHLAGVRSLHEARAKLLVGTDASASTSAAHGISVHRELQLLTGAGLSPIEALRAATMNAANAFRLTDRGRIAAGRKADLVLVRGNPTADITATRDILRVWRSGVEFDRRLAQ
jgi:imidazolonepropionase-like amidohydrolase